MKCERCAFMIVNPSVGVAKAMLLLSKNYVLTMQKHRFGSVRTVLLLGFFDVLKI